MGDPGLGRRRWPLRHVHLPFECRKLRLFLCQWSHRPRFNRSAFPPPSVSAVPLCSFPFEHFQDNPVVCVYPGLPNPRVEKGVSTRAKDVVPLPCHLLFIPFVYHVQNPSPLYLLLGMKLAVMPSSPNSAITGASYSSRTSRGSRSLMLRSPRSMTFTPFAAFPSAYSTRATLGASFGGMYAPTTYHLCRPVVNKKITTFRT